MLTVCALGNAILYLAALIAVSDFGPVIFGGKRGSVFHLVARRAIDSARASEGWLGIRNAENGSPKES